MVGWHHRLNRQGFGQTLGVGHGQGSLVCCGSWGCKESDTTEQLNWTELTPILPKYKTIPYLRYAALTDQNLEPGLLLDHLSTQTLGSRKYVSF